MPYIKPADREKFKEIILPSIDKVGELNYVLTSICNWYLENKPVSYQVYNDVIGALECAKLEYYRRKVSIYEERKLAENGDV